MVKTDYTLYLVTDSEMAGTRDLAGIVGEALRGGVTIVQYREKRNMPVRWMLAEIESLRAVTRKFQVPLIINDRLDLSLLTDADGLHVGQDDIPADLARKQLGTDRLLGVSVRSIEEAELAVVHGADYLAVSGVFPTLTKPDVGRPIGSQLIQTLVHRFVIPVIGIGGIHPGNAEEVIRMGASGVAVVSAIMKSDNPYQAARVLRCSLSRQRL